MIMPGPDGKPLMSWRDWLPAGGNLEKLQNSLREAAAVIEPGSQQSSAAGLFEEKRLYQWQDAQGQWHFSDTPNPASVPVASKPLPVIVNRMQPVSIPGADAADNSVMAGAINFSPTTIPVEKIPGMIDDALNIQKLSDQYARQLEEI